MNHAGKVRLWDSISIGLAGGGNYTEASLNLGPYETVSHLVRTHVRSSLFPVFLPPTRSALLQPQTFVASTTQGQFFKIVHTAVGGKHHLVSANCACTPRDPKSESDRAKIACWFFKDCPAASVLFAKGYLNLCGACPVSEDRDMPQPRVDKHTLVP